METDEMCKTIAAQSNNITNIEEDIDPVDDIIDYLVRIAKISFKTAHVNEKDVRTSENIRLARINYKKSPTNFLSQFGKYLMPNHVEYFENIRPFGNIDEDERFQKCVEQLKHYHSDECTRKRVRNRRYRALQKLQNDGDYFSEKEMMFRNPLLYEQLVGQYLTDDEIRERDGVDNENLTFLNMILDTVDRNKMRERKNEQMLSESLEAADINEKDDTSLTADDKLERSKSKWGEFDVPDTRLDPKPEVRKQTMINAPERELLREEFLQEMYSSFIEGRDFDVDYYKIDNDEEYDDLQQVSRDAEDRYFDSESTDVENLEQHMQLIEEYGRKDSTDNGEDPLEIFMEHLNNKLVSS